MSDPRARLRLPTNERCLMFYSDANYADLSDWDYPDNWLDEPEDFMSDAEADADALASIGWGTDEDYYYGGEDVAMEYAWGDC